jgi:uncharacterized membrane protein YbjE (DUF340 family)
MDLGDACLIVGAVMIGLICWICPGVLFAYLLGIPLFSAPGIAVMLGWLPFAGVCLLLAYLAILLAASAVAMVFGK